MGSGGREKGLLGSLLPYCLDGDHEMLSAYKSAYPNLEHKPQFGHTNCSCATSVYCGCEFFSQFTFPTTNTLLAITEIKWNLMYHQNISLNINDGLCK